MTRTILTFMFCVGLFSCSVQKTEPKVELAEAKTSVDSNYPDKNFRLIEDFEITSSMFIADTFDLADQSSEGGELVAFHSKHKEYLVIDIWLFGEMGKTHSVYWTDKQMNFIIVQQTDFVYDKPYTEEDYKVEETTEFFSYSGNSFKRYNTDKQEISSPDNIESEKKMKDFFVAVTKDLEIIK